VPQLEEAHVQSKERQFLHMYYLLLDKFTSPIFANPGSAGSNASYNIKLIPVVKKYSECQ